jgi:hypothetical protein
MTRSLSLRLTGVQDKHGETSLMTRSASLRLTGAQDKHGETSLMTRSASLRLTGVQDKYGETSLMTGRHAPEAAFQARGASKKEELFLLEKGDPPVESEACGKQR